MRTTLWVIAATLGASAFAAPSIRNPIRSLPLHFEPAAEPNRFVATGTRYSLALGPAGYELTVPQAGARPAKVSTRFLGAERRVRLEAVESLPFKSSYFVGERTAWRPDVASYSKVRYHALYPGIDLVFYGSEGNLEYDFILQPGADPRRIRLRVAGATGIALDDNGDLVLKTIAGEVRWNKPLLYQEAGPMRSTVAGSFVRLDADTIGFRVDEYDRKRTLVIDPSLGFSTLLGGKGHDGVRAVAVDDSGNTYVAGGTQSADFPISKTGYQLAFAGQTANAFTGDAFVAKFNSSGTPVFITFLGGRADDWAMGITVDSSGNIFVTGATDSADFPTVSPLQSRMIGAGSNDLFQIGDAFVAKIAPAGDKLVYSTFLGGLRDDMGMAIAVDSSGSAYVAGWTLSFDFPVTPSAFQQNLRGSGGQGFLPRFGGVGIRTGDVFVSKLNPAGSQLVYSTLVGGSLDDTPNAIAVDSSGNVYVAGATASGDFPTTAGAFQRNFGGQDRQNPFFHMGDAFVFKLNPAGSGLVYSTFLGGSGDEGAAGLAVDSTGNAYVTGSTTSTDFPTTLNIFQRTYRGPSFLPFFDDNLIGDAFVTKIKPDGSGLVFSTYLGGEGEDGGFAVAVDATGNVYVAGSTASALFPVTSDAAQKTLATKGSYYYSGDGFLTVLNPSGTSLVYGTYLGGGSAEFLNALALDHNGNVTVAGWTMSTDYPTTTSAYQRQLNAGNATGNLDGFIARYTGFPSPNTPAGPTINAIVHGASAVVGAGSPGLVFVAYGSMIGPKVTTPVGAAVDPATGLLASSRSGTRFLFDGVPAPIVYVSDGQSAGIIPYEVAGKSSAQVIAEFNGQQSAPFTLAIAPTNPGLFSANFSGTGQGAIFNGDGTPNSASNPAARGSVIVLYGTGEGQTVPAGVTGRINNSVFPTPAGNVTVLIGGKLAGIQYKGAVPQQVAGIFQMNVVVPDDAPLGNQPVLVQIGNGQSQANLTVALK